jgi:hypothetical protein
MSNLEKAMVLLDMARDHIRDAVQGTDDLRDLIEDIDQVVLTLERFSKWPRWD